MTSRGFELQMGISSKAFGKKLPPAFRRIWSCRKVQYFLVLILMNDGRGVVWFVYTLFGPSRSRVSTRSMYNQCILLGYILWQANIGSPRDRYLLQDIFLKRTLYGCCRKSAQQIKYLRTSNDCAPLVFTMSLYDKAQISSIFFRPGQ